MILDKKDLFYQSVMRKGLQVYDVDGLTYGYDVKNDCLVYEKWVDGSWRYAVLVSIGILEFYQGAEQSFNCAINEEFSEAYVKRINRKLTRPDNKTSGYINLKTFERE